MCGGCGIDDMKIFIVLALFLIDFTICEPGEKSRAKCKEYAKHVYTEEESPVLSRRSKVDKVSQCGIVEVPLVIGGVKAIPKEFPHMAVIGFGKSKDDPEIFWACGGSLISDNFVLTAAHCTIHHSGPPQKIRVGEVNFLTDDESEIQERNIESITKHPGYKKMPRQNDIALIKLDKPVEFNGFVRPACIETKMKIPEKQAIATGFGRTSFDVIEGSKDLMKVTLNIIDRDACAKYFKFEISTGVIENIGNIMLCAGELKGGKDTCQGDSGGPLQIVLSEPYCMYSVIGVVSFGKFCGFENQPGIYTNVAAYIPWIENIVWP